MSEVEFEPGWLAEEFRRVREEIASWPKSMQDLTPLARWKREHPEEIARMPTHEERMREAIDAGFRAPMNTPLTDGMDLADVFGISLIEHGVAAIRAAVAEERARIVAWIRAERAAVCPGYRSERDIISAAEADSVAQLITAGAPDAWAARTGWKHEP